MKENDTLCNGFCIDQRATPNRNKRPNIQSGQQTNNVGMFYILMHHFHNITKEIKSIQQSWTHVDTDLLE